ncbi:FRG domain-containing protein [Xanthomonas euvesicatoria]|uniref:FRG domain-containing protein n=1 Tax=Xanthomonas euvesicatoria TaxID=456327 RepID=UPI0004A34BDB|nr:FRG domain-containing protein [Xanthomonas euvesicatoria]QTK47156.1 FRG domain-containing protein [Xanthomonas euvesicatoria pv. alfalfae]
MRTIHCSTLEELDLAIKAAGPDALFRGQVDHFPRKDGTPSLTTSFARQGCIPDLMIKWHHYARQALSRHVKGWSGAKDMSTDQAILQHYGWRSFYLDATGNPSVACWFASNKFTLKKHIELVEDCFEDPVYLVSDGAIFEKSEGIGNLYIISRKNLRSAGIGAVHLSEIATANGSPRYLRQDAYMVGPIEPEGLASDCLAYHLTAPSSVLSAYAGELSTKDLFPDPNIDPIYAELLAMPWEKIEIQTEGIEAFRRALALPEYDLYVRKHMPASAAMYRHFWLLDLPHDPDDKTSLLHVLCGSAIYHGSSEKPIKLTKITELISKFDGILIELDGLIYFGMQTTYGKGVLAIKREPNLVAVCEIGIEHPGLQIHDCGLFRGIHYHIDAQGSWSRAHHPDDCDCGLEHDESFRLLGRINDAIEEGFITIDSTGAYIQQGIKRASDAVAVREYLRRLE